MTPTLSKTAMPMACLTTIAQAQRVSMVTWVSFHQPDPAKTHGLPVNARNWNHHAHGHICGVETQGLTPTLSKIAMATAFLTTIAVAQRVTWVSFHQLHPVETHGQGANASDHANAHACGAQTHFTTNTLCKTAMAMALLTRIAPTRLVIRRVSFHQLHLAKTHGLLASVMREITSARLRKKQQPDQSRYWLQYQTCS